MIIKNLSTLIIHKLTQEQYDREKAAGRLDENALYLTPDTSSTQVIVTADNTDIDSFFSVDGIYFPTGEAGFYRHGTNFTELLCTWDEYIANGVTIDGEFYEGGINHGTPNYLMFTMPTDVIIPEGYRYELMSIECGNIVIPADVSSVGLVEWGAYKDLGTTYPDVHGDIKLTTIYIKATTPPNYPSLSNCPNLEKIVVPKGCAEVYKSATNWCDYAEIIVEGIIE